MLVLGEVDRVALDLDRDRHDLVVEAALGPRGGGAPVRRSGELVLALAADRVLLGQVLGRDAHQDRVERVGQPAHHRVDHSASPIRAPQRALGIQYGPRLIDSAPPASATDASPVWIAWHADTIACTPVPHRRLTV